MRIGPELLQDLLDQVEGSLAAAIGTPDGLLVEGVRKRPLDLEAAIAEHAALWRQARAAYARSLGAEEVGELLVGGTGVVGYLRSMRTRDPEPLFLLLLLAPEANLGQARLAARRLLDRAGGWWRGLLDGLVGLGCGPGGVHGDGRPGH
ncbi:hypothetical protein TTHN1_00026 [Thermus thermophilus]|uniref:Roadblock/LAMTOR2 domain-containing protein n=1 Tax=Thermus thermophilus TaxID=274 RepID=A0A3P4AMG0_THETH|nr:hypothetical protein [Thermus thermophilus]VCU52281.1 hypothetical protein TTHN1_00026 [Thermus thermophilus]